MAGLLYFIAKAGTFPVAARLSSTLSLVPRMAVPSLAASLLKPPAAISGECARCYCSIREKGKSSKKIPKGGDRDSNFVVKQGNNCLLF